MARRRIITIALLIGGMLGLAGGVFVGYRVLPLLSSAGADRRVGDEGQATFIRAAAEASPAVVNIRTESRRGPGARGVHPFLRDPLFQELFKHFAEPSPGSEVETSLGSGVIIDRQGYILTNNHVVEGALAIRVRLADKRELDGRVIGKDPRTDLAVIKVESEAALPEARLGNSDRLRVGEWALAIGNPFGLDHTVTVGVISATGRAELGVASYEHFIQTDASINPGNSGGPLLNIQGEVVGINTAILSSGQGIGFAIPISLARRIAQDLIDKGRVVRGWLGIGLRPLTAEVARALGTSGRGGGVFTQVT
ncbi:MAG: trypsin-like peptidase domain-containing protein, partial [Candidatus Methylomirabilales bacterium]